MSSVYAPLVSGQHVGVVPGAERKFNDLPFACLFAIGVVLFIALGIFGFNYGDPSILEEQALADAADPSPLAPLINGTNPLVVSFVVVLVFAIVWIQLLRFAAPLVVKGTLWGGIVALIVFGLFLQNKSDETPSAQYAAWMIWIVALIFILMIFFARNKIEFTILLFENGCRALSHSPGSLIVGFALVTVVAVVFSFYIAASSFILTIQESPLVNCLPDETAPCQAPRNLWIIFSGLVLWIGYFCNGLAQVTISGSIASHLYNQTTSGLASFGRALKSFGSIALASLLIALITLLRIIVNALQHAARKEGEDIKVQIMLCLIKCCVRCIESIVKYISHYAYIFIAKDGRSFCSACGQTVEMISNNVFTMAVSNSISGFVMLIGQLVGVAVAMLFATMILDASAEPILLVVIFFLAFSIMSVTTRLILVAIDTVMVCFFADESISIDGELASALRGFDEAEYKGTM
ncbi:hypothetical protein P9112_008754 [Eukaryota sp. TZLM1-RC]